jgi:hypothetical protein
MSENDRTIQLHHLGENEVRLPREVEFIMQRAFGLSIPQTLDDVCDPARFALVVYDMQVGIVNQIENAQQIIDRVLQVLDAARKAGIRVFFTRHMSLPKELMGVSQFRMAMAWQRVKLANEVKQWLSKTLVVSVIAMRPNAPLRASNLRAMLCLRMPIHSVLSLGAALPHKREPLHSYDLQLCSIRVVKWLSATPALGV